MLQVFRHEDGQPVCRPRRASLGGAGYLAKHDVERLYRDVRLLRIFECTSQIRQTITARHMIKDEANYS